MSIFQASLVFILVSKLLCQGICFGLMNIITLLLFKLHFLFASLLVNIRRVGDVLLFLIVLTPIIMQIVSILQQQKKQHILISVSVSIKYFT